MITIMTRDQIIIFPVTVSEIKTVMQLVVSQKQQRYTSHAGSPQPDWISVCMCYTITFYGVTQAIDKHAVTGNDR